MPMAIETGTVRIGYADPPYPGQAAKHYGSHCDYDGEVDHFDLLKRLDAEYDGWLLHTSSTALPTLIGYATALNVGPYRVMAWVKPFAIFKRNVSVAYAWEPVLIKAARKPVVSKRIVMRDWVSENITLRKGLVGVKPEAVCRWAFEMLGAHPDDELVDLFPGTGAVTRAWRQWCADVDAGQQTLHPPGGLRTPPQPGKLWVVGGERPPEPEEDKMSDQEINDRLQPCECSEWETGAEYETDGQPDMDIITTITTDCESLTSRTFAPGHDAKLKSLMVRAGVNGWEMRCGRESGVLRTMSWAKAADAFGFGPQVYAAVAAAQDRRAAQAPADTPAGAPKLTAHQTALVTRVREYAASHAHVNGWEQVNDGMSDQDIATVIGRIHTGERAIRRMRAHLDRLTRSQAR